MVTTVALVVLVVEAETGAINKVGWFKVTTLIELKLLPIMQYNPLVPSTVLLLLPNLSFVVLLQVFEMENHRETKNHRCL